MKKVKKQISKIKFFYYKVAFVLTIAVMMATVFQLPQIFIHSANTDMKQVIKDVSSTETLVVENELSVKTTVLPLSDNQLQVTLDVVSELPSTSLENDQFILLVDQSASMNEYQETYETAIKVFKQSVAEKSNETAQIQEMYYNVATPELENQFSTLTEAISSLSTLLSESDASKTHVLLVTDSVLNDEIPSTEVTVSEEEIQVKMPEVIEVPETVVTEEQIQAKMPEVIEVPEVTISEGEEIDVEARQAELEQEAYDQAYALATEAAKQEAYNQAYEVAYQEAYQLATEQVKSEKTLTANQENYQSIVQGFNQSLTELSELTKDSDLSVLALPNKARESQVDYQTITQIEMTDLSELEVKLMEWVSTFEHTQTFNQFNLNYEVSSLFKIVENSLTSTVEGVTLDNSQVNINLQENIPTTMNLSFTVELLNDETEINESVTLTNAANVSYQLAEGDLKTSDLPTTEVNIETIITEIDEQNSNDQIVNTPVNNEVVDGYSSTNLPTINLQKTASEWENDRAQITLEANGQGISIEPKNADIVLVIDTSGSMGDRESYWGDSKLGKIKDVLKGTSQKKGFIDQLLEINTDTKKYVNIAIVTFSDSASIKTKLTSDANTLKNTIGSLSANGATNTADGIQKAADALGKSTRDAEQYVILLTDGFPTNYSTPYDEHFRSAQKKYYTYFTNASQGRPTKIGGIGVNPSKVDLDLQDPPVYPSAKFYSIGLFFDNDDPYDGWKKEIWQSKAVEFLNTIQNIATNEEDYRTNYYTSTLSGVETAYNNIAQQIAGQINNTLATNPIITDTITDPFIIDQDSITITDSAGNNLSDKYTYQITITDDGYENITITANRGVTIDTSGLKITFDILAENPYLAGDGIYTNVGNATLESDERELDYVGTPTVNIPPKIGTIKVTKLVEGGQPKDSDRFSITMESVKETYTVDLKAGQSNSQTLTFYMRDEDTPIELNTAYTDYNYLMVGEYEVSELLPANYEFKGITINDEPNKEKFMIDEDNDEIFITVTNELVNENYWYHQTNRQNEFKYEYTPSPENPSVDK